MKMSLLAFSCALLELYNYHIIIVYIFLFLV